VHGQGESSRGNFRKGGAPDHELALVLLTIRR
jgi:hypothetical protein